MGYTRKYVKGEGEISTIYEFQGVGEKGAGAFHSAGQSKEG